MIVRMKLPHNVNKPGADTVGENDCARHHKDGETGIEPGNSRKDERYVSTSVMQLQTKLRRNAAYDMS